MVDRPIGDGSTEYFDKHLEDVIGDDKRPKKVFTKHIGYRCHTHKEGCIQELAQKGTANGAQPEVFAFCEVFHESHRDRVWEAATQIASQTCQYDAATAKPAQDHLKSILTTIR